MIKKMLLIAAVCTVFGTFMFVVKAKVADRVTKGIREMHETTQDRTKRTTPCDLPLSDTELRKVLSPEQYRVMRENGTEVPFQNAYWNNKKAGLYVDAISGEPLFSSTDKFDSGTGWPSFTAPLQKNFLVERQDTSHGMTRIEVRARKSDSHLGHVFPDGPGPAGLRYCINSAALRFIPAEDLEREGYGEYAGRFQKNPPSLILPKTETADFGAGCFWGVESAFQQIKGVTKTTVGYMGGHTQHPTYEDVCTGKTGHAETVEVTYDPSQISYDELLDIFWTLHDPTTRDRQGPDIGTQYRSVVFYRTPEQQKAAILSMKRAEQSGRFKNKIVTEISPASEFWQAEAYHQNYFERRGIKPTCHLPSKYPLKS